MVLDIERVRQIKTRLDVVRGQLTSSAAQINYLETQRRHLKAESLELSKELQELMPDVLDYALSR